MSSLRGAALRALRQPAAWSGGRSAATTAAAAAAAAAAPHVQPRRPAAAAVDDDSCASFATLFRGHPTAYPLRGGERLFGKVVAASRGRSRGARFVLADFGLKTEVPFAVRELPPGEGAVGSSLTLPLVSLENVFGEPQLDVGGGLGGGSGGAAALASRVRMVHPPPPPPPSSSSQSPSASSLSSSKPAATAVPADHPAAALVPTAPTAVTSSATRAPPPRRVPLRIFHGRYAAEQRGGVVAKVLGLPGFIPNYHVVVLNKVKLGSYAPFVLLSSEVKRHGGGGGGGGGSAMGGGSRGIGPPGPVGAGRSAAGGVGGSGGGLVVYPVYSPYLGYLLTLSNLVGFDDAWAASGGGGARERASYLRLLTRIAAADRALEGLLKEFK
ncbi:hypothetical protein MMPV_001376 [Pyropia vietnamensis]